MYRNNSIGVVVPAYNEKGFVGDVIREMPSFVDTIYVIDDCSTDETWDEVLGAARTIADDGDRGSSSNDPGWQAVADGGTSVALLERATVYNRIGRLVPIQHRENRGAGGAIKTGYIAAESDGVDITVTVDGDGQMDLEEMPRLLDPIIEGRADYTKANRLLYDEYSREMPRFRLFGNVILSFLTKIASGYWRTSDPQNGYTAISRHALEAIDLENVYEYYGYCNDLLVKLNAKRIRVADVAIPAIYGEEESDIKYTTYIRKVSGMLLRNFMWRLKVRLFVDFHLAALFYLFSAAASGLGVLGVVWSLFDRQRDTSIAEVLSRLSFIASLFALLSAILLDMKENETLEEVISE